MENKWSKENLEKIVSLSKSKNEVLDRMGLRKAGSNNRTLRKYLDAYAISTQHFNKNWYKISEYSKNKKLDLNEILVENSNYSRSKLKERLYKEGLKERFCEICGQGEIWNDKKMSLILDHKNGIYNDNRIENLRIVCPNCNSTLPTHCGKNKITRKEKIISIEHLKSELEIKNRNEILSEYEKNYTLEKNIRDIETLNRLKESEIDFKKFGWVTKASKIIGIRDQAVNKWMKRMDPEFYQKCYVRK
jgi:hypothetical protein